MNFKIEITSAIASAALPRGHLIMGTHPISYT